MNDMRDRLSMELVLRGERRTAAYRAAEAEAARRRRGDEERRELARRWLEAHGGEGPGLPENMRKPA